MSIFRIVLDYYGGTLPEVEPNGPVPEIDWNYTFDQDEKDESDNSWFENDQ